MEKISPHIYDVSLGRVTDFGNETKQFEFLLAPGKAIDFIAGQFVAVLCPLQPKLIRRAYSIASAPEEKGHLELIIKLVQGGAVTNWFWSLQPGTTMQVHGPFGKFILPEPADFDPVFVATGTGIAPFRSMIRHMLPAGFRRNIWLIFGARYDTMIPYHQEWLDLAARYPNFHYVPTISRPGPEWRGETGYVQTKMDKVVPQPEGKRVYICGLTDMVLAVQDACLKLGYTKEQILFEKYD